MLAEQHIPTSTYVTAAAERIRDHHGEPHEWLMELARHEDLVRAMDGRLGDVTKLLLIAARRTAEITREIEAAGDYEAIALWVRWQELTSVLINITRAEFKRDRERKGAGA